MTTPADRSTAAPHGAAVPAPTGTAAPTPRRPVASAAAGGASGTNATPGARRIAVAFERAAADGRAALIPYVVAGYPDIETSLRAAVAAVDAGADLLEVGLPYSDPLADGATLQRATHAALLAGATLDASVELIRAIAAARPAVPLVPMCYANQVIGGGDGRAAATRLAGAGASGLIVADLTPDEGLRFETIASEVGLAVVYLIAPTSTPARRVEVARRSGGFPLLRLARRRHRRPHLAAGLGQGARGRCEGRLTRARRGRFRRQQARPRADARQGRRRRRDRGVGPHRRAGARRSRCSGPDRPCREAARRDRSLRR